MKLAYPAGPYDANIARVKVELPEALPSRLTTLQKACLASVFEANPAGCPAASIIGHATATTPVLPVPLAGPAYFVSPRRRSVPDLIVVLQGYGVTVHLVGTTFISKAGITSSTFKTVPDVPVGTFELTLPAGPVLGAGREREPLQDQAGDAHRIRRAERRGDPHEHQDRGHGLRARRRRRVDISARSGRRTKKRRKQCRQHWSNRRGRREWSGHAEVDGVLRPQRRVGGDPARADHRGDHRAGARAGCRPR